MSQTVQITQQEYDHLLETQEDYEDMLAVAAWQANPGQTFPAHVVDRLIEGEHPLTVMREWRGLTQSALSERTGVSRVMIGDIEKRGKGGSIPTLRKLADALDVMIDDIVPD